MIPAARHIAELLIALAVAPLCAQAAATLRAYRCSITLEPGNRARVAVDVVIDGVVGGSPLEFTRIAYSGQSVSGLQFETSGSNAQPVPQGALERYRFAPAGGTISADFAYRRGFEYIVEPAAPDGVVRIPLVVPNPPARPGARAVELEIHLGSGMVPVGDTFPRFSWSEGNIGKTLLSNVPTFVRVAARPAAEASLTGSLLRDTTFLNDAAIILFLVVGSAFWWSRNRRQ